MARRRPYKIIKASPDLWDLATELQGDIRDGLGIDVSITEITGFIAKKSKRKMKREVAKIKERGFLF